MDYDRFIGLVQSRAHLPSMGAAVAATRATLQTLAERIGANEARHVAAQLPREIAFYLNESFLETGERFSFDEFCQRVAKREPADLPDAIFHARCVIETLEEAVTAGEMSDVIGLLPEEFIPLFAAGHEGKLPRRG